MSSALLSRFDLVSYSSLLSSPSHSLSFPLTISRCSSYLINLTKKLTPYCLSTSWPFTLGPGHLEEDTASERESVCERGRERERGIERVRVRERGSVREGEREGERVCVCAHAHFSLEPLGLG